MKSTIVSIQRAVIYARVSNSRGGTKRSVPQQLEDGRAVIAQNNWPAGPEITDDTSASRYAAKDRPGYKKLLTILRPGDVLVIWEQSRTSRRLKEWVELRDLCVELGVLMCVNGELLNLTDTNSRLSTGIKAVVNEHESDQLRDRLNRDIGRRALRGDPHARLGFGYRKVYAADGSWTWQEDGDEGAAIRWAVQHILGGGSIRSVQKEWAARGIKRPQAEDTAWSISSIRQLLARPKLAGRRTLHGEDVAKASWPAIISEDEHAQLVAVLKGRRLTEPRGQHPQHLLTSIMTCSVCEEPVTWQNRGKGGRYVCRARGCLARRAPAADKYVIERVHEIIADWKVDAFLFDVDDETPQIGSELVRITAELEVLEKRLQEFRDFATKGMIPVADFVSARAELEPQIEDLKAQSKSAMISPLLALFAKDAEVIWEDMSLVDQRALVRLTAAVTMERVGPGKTKGVGVKVKSIAPDRSLVTTAMLEAAKSARAA